MIIDPRGAPAPRTPPDRWLIGIPYGLRIRDHQRITDYSRPGGNLEVARREAVVSKCSEVRSLLHYLRELLVFKFSVFHMRPAHDVGLHNEDSWHVTPQTNELYAKRQGLSTPTHGKYVECHWPSECS